MKIVDRKTFLAMPKGTVFTKYQPCSFEDVRIKDESNEIDFFYSDISGAIDHRGSDEFLQQCIAAEKGASIPMNFDGLARDGLFDQDQLFAVWEPQDIQQLVDKLLSCMPKPSSLLHKAAFIMSTLICSKGCECNRCAAAQDFIKDFEV